MILQNAPGSDRYLGKYGCLFCVLARSRERDGFFWTSVTLSDAWNSAIRAGCITGDLNHNGTLDDPGEAVIRDYPGLIRLLRLPLGYLPPEELGLPLFLDHGVPRVAPTKESLDLTKYWVAEKWVWKLGHFVQGDGSGRRSPIYDPLGHSYSRLNGRLESLRVFERLI